MPTQPDHDMPAAPASSGRLALAFLLLFVAYQLPEGLGARILHSFPVQAALMVAFLPMAWLAGRRLGFRGLDAWYLGLRPGWGLLLAAAFALALLAKAATLAVGAGAGIYRIAFPAGLTAGSACLSALALLPETFIPSVAEDIVTRGFLMRALPGLSRRRLFIACSALLYTLNHIYRFQEGALELARIFCFGLAYAAALYYSRSLWAAVGLHWGWNFAGQLGDRVADIDLLDPLLGPKASPAVLEFGARPESTTASHPGPAKALHTSRCDEIGRRSGLKIRRGNPYRFDSGRRHHARPPPGSGPRTSS
jgi:uncharacterized protein